MCDTYYDDDRRSPFLTFVMILCFIAICAMIVCALKRGELSNQTNCYDEVSRAEAISTDYSCHANRQLVIVQTGTTTLVKCVCYK